MSENVEYIRKTVLIPYCEIKVKLLKWGMTEEDFVKRLIEDNNYKEEVAINYAQRVFKPSIEDDNSDREQYQKLKDDDYQINFQEKLESLFDISEFPELEFCETKE